MKPLKRSSATRPSKRASRSPRRSKRQKPKAVVLSRDRPVLVALFFCFLPEISLNAKHRFPSISLRQQERGTHELFSAARQLTNRSPPSAPWFGVGTTPRLTSRCHRLHSSRLHAHRLHP